MTQSEKQSVNDLPEGWTTNDLEAVIQNYQSGFASGKKDVAAGVSHLRMNNIGVKGEVVLDLAPFLRRWRNHNTT